MGSVRCVEGRLQEVEKDYQINKDLHEDRLKSFPGSIIALLYSKKGRRT